jgi:hypothetical protein
MGSPHYMEKTQKAKRTTLARRFALSRSRAVKIVHYVCVSLWKLDFSKRSRLNGLQRLFNNALTGTRVPRKTGVPLTISGSIVIGRRSNSLASITNSIRMPIDMMKALIFAVTIHRPDAFVREWQLFDTKSLLKRRSVRTVA